MTDTLQPLTPPDCDLRGLPFMPLDVVRVIDSDLFALSTGDEFKAAVALWCKAWLQIPAASLPDDDRILAHLSGAGSRWRKIKAIALRNFVKCSDGRLYHMVIAEKANDAWERRGEWQEKQNNKTERQQRWRARVKEISDELRRLGVTPPTNASLSTLESLLASTSASTGASTVDDDETALTGTGTGTGTGTEEENKPPLHAANGEAACGAGKKYAFAGKVIRLNQADLDSWETAYGALPDLRAELATLDIWIADQDEATRKRWFHVISGVLNKKHQAAQASAKRNREAVGGYVTDDGWEMPIA